MVDRVHQVGTSSQPTIVVPAESVEVPIQALVGPQVQYCSVVVVPEVVSTVLFPLDPELAKHEGTYEV